MKYLPLVWAAVMRKPTRAILTLLSVMLAFTLFGLTIGMNATFDKLKEEARNDQFFLRPLQRPHPHRHGAPDRTAARRLLVASSALSAATSRIKNRVFVNMMDENMPKVVPKWPITPQQ